MKIAYIVRHIDSAGGRERVVTNKANYFVKNCGYEVFIITMVQREHRTVFWLDERVQVRHLRLSSRASFPGGRIRYSRYIKSALESELKTISPDITVSMWWGAEFRVLPFIRDGSQKILEFHSSNYMREFEHRASVLPILSRLRWAVTKWLEERIVRRYAKFIVLTNEDRESWKVKNAIVIPDALSFVSRKQSNCSNHLVVTAGRLTKSKGFDRLIDIWAVIERDHPDWSLRIFGDGEERDNLSRLIEARKLKSVSLMPTTSNIQDEMLQASIFAFTSRYEGFGLVLIEAMQCGLPVVSYRTKCGPSEIVTDTVSGFLVDEGDEPAFIERLQRMIGDLALRQKMGDTAKRLSETKFGEDLVMTKWKKLFEDLVDVS